MIKRKWYDEDFKVEKIRLILKEKNQISKCLCRDREGN